MGLMLVPSSLQLVLAIVVVIAQTALTAPGHPEQSRPFRQPYVFQHGEGRTSQLHRESDPYKGAATKGICPFLGCDQHMSFNLGPWEPAANHHQSKNMPAEPASYIVKHRYSQARTNYCVSDAAGVACGAASTASTSPAASDNGTATRRRRETQLSPAISTTATPPPGLTVYLSDGSPTWNSSVIRQSEVAICVLLDAACNVFVTDGTDLEAYDQSGHPFGPAIFIQPPFGHVLAPTVTNNNAFVLASNTSTLGAYLTNGVPQGSIVLNATVDGVPGAFYAQADPAAADVRTYFLTSFRPSNIRARVNDKSRTQPPLCRIYAVDVVRKISERLHIGWWVAVPCTAESLERPVMFAVENAQGNVTVCVAASSDDPVGSKLQCFVDLGNTTRQTLSIDVGGTLGSAALSKSFLSGGHCGAAGIGLTSDPQIHTAFAIVKSTSSGQNTAMLIPISDGAAASQVSLPAPQPNCLLSNDIQPMTYSSLADPSYLGVLVGFSCSSEGDSTALLAGYNISLADSTMAAALTMQADVSHAGRVRQIVAADRQLFVGGDRQLLVLEPETA